jgi:hypothetical protein
MINTDHQVDLTVVNFGIRRAIAESMLLSGASVDVVVRREAGIILAMVKARILAEEVDSRTVIYPKDWWEAFKERWFPVWLQRRYPVKKKIIEYRTMLAYPQSKVKCPDSITSGVKFAVLTEYTREGIVSYD